MSCTLAIIAPSANCHSKRNHKIDQDCEDREHQPDDAVGKQFARHAWSDHLYAPIVDFIAERAANFADRLLLRHLSARLFGDADEHIVRRTELLQLHFAEAKRPERGAHLRKIGSPCLRLHLDQRAALEVDAEIQPVEEIERDRDNRQEVPTPES